MPRRWIFSRSVLDLLGHRVPVDVAGLVAGAFVFAEARVAVRQVELELVERALHERFEADLQLAGLQLDAVQRLLDGGVLGAELFDALGQALDGLADLLHLRRRAIRSAPPSVCCFSTSCASAAFADSSSRSTPPRRLATASARLGDPLDLLGELRLRGRLPLHLLLAGELLLLDLPEQHALGRELLAGVAELLAELLVRRGQLLDLLLPRRLVGFHRLPLLGERRLFGLQPPDLLEERRQLALQQRLLAVQRREAVVGLGDLARQLDLGGVRLVDLVAQRVLLLLQVPGGRVAFGHLRR